MGSAYKNTSNIVHEHFVLKEPHQQQINFALKGINTGFVLYLYVCQVFRLSSSTVSIWHHLVALLSTSPPYASGRVRPVPPELILPGRPFLPDPGVGLGHLAAVGLALADVDVAGCAVCVRGRKDTFFLSYAN